MDSRFGTGRLTAMRRKALEKLTVRRKPGIATRGWLVAGPWTLPVALGRGGIKANKREGDGGTPRGTFRPVRLWWRADRGPRPATRLPVRRIGPQDGWCEDPSDRLYNRPVRVAAGSEADRLMRADALYDLIVEIDHNMRPRVAGRGSAVFIHLARPGFAPTAGCVALTGPALRRLVARLGPKTRIVIE
jgi:L,D-peptidoglycan transpeptidase YkuD (ErfK/YbiS/YcfS/YnhG family)